MMDRAERAAPFSGLGFDLRVTREAAQTMQLRSCRPEPKQVAVWPGEVPPRQYGYGLLLFLNQETGGS